MKLLCVMVGVLLSVVGWCARPTKAWVIPMVNQYLDIEREMERYLATPTGLRTADPVFKALRMFGRQFAHSRSFNHLMHYEWMMTDQLPRPDSPETTTRVMNTAKQWACARFVDSLLSQLFRSTRQQWVELLAQDDDMHGIKEVYEALELYTKAEIARFHEAAQIEIALSFGDNDSVVRPKYLELAQTCIADYL